MTMAVFYVFALTENIFLSLVLNSEKKNTVLNTGKDRSDNPVSRRNPDM